MTSECGEFRRAADTATTRARMEADDRAGDDEWRDKRIAALETALYELASAALAFRILAAPIDKGVEKRLQKAVDRAKSLCMKEGR